MWNFSLVNLSYLPKHNKYDFLLIHNWKYKLFIFISTFLYSLLVLCYTYKMWKKFALISSIISFYVDRFIFCQNNTFYNFLKSIIITTGISKSMNKYWIMLILWDYNMTYLFRKKYLNCESFVNIMHKNLI